MGLVGVARGLAWDGCLAGVARRLGWDVGVTGERIGDVVVEGAAG